MSKKPATPPSPARRSSTAKLASSPLRDAFKTQEKSKLSAINSMLHQSPSSNSVFSMVSGSGIPSGNTPPPQNMFNTHIMANRSSRPGSSSDLDIDIPNFAVDISDHELLNEVHKHLVSENPLMLPGGDVTRDLYKYQHAMDSTSDSGASSLKSSDRPGRIKRSSSFSLAERRGSSASGINVPGGFRREYIVKKKKDDKSRQSTGGSPLVNDNLVDSTELPPFLARNFVEFLSIYGHFAGEELEDEDFQTCTLSKSQLLPEDEENTPLLAASRASLEPARTATPMKAFFLLLKSFVGTGILFLPKAFCNGGLLFSAVTLMFFAIYSYWCYYILITTKDSIRVSSFGEMGSRLYGPLMKSLIIFSIILSQIGFVGAYLVFTSTNLKAFIFNILNINLELSTLILAQCLIFIPLALIRNITKLSLSSLVANFFIFLGLVVIIHYTFLDLATNGISKDIKNFNSQSWSLFIGVAIFAFEGIGLIIPIQESMIEPQKFPKVLFFVILTVSFLMLLIGVLCYSTYGDATNTVIILNLPQDSIFVNCVQLFYSIAILLSAPLQLFPVIKIIENYIFGKNYRGKLSATVKWLKNGLRSMLVIVCCVIAYYGSSNLDRFVSIIGCFACIPLVYMYPPMLHYKAVSKTRLQKGFDIFLVIFGGLAMVYVAMQLRGA